MDKRSQQGSDGGGWDNELALLENLRWSRKEFMDRICEASRSEKDNVLETLRLEATYQFAEFFFLLRARGIETVSDIERLAELHNQYVVNLMKDQKNATTKIEPRTRARCHVDVRHVAATAAKLARQQRVD
jgi:hypothetical protein